MYVTRQLFRFGEKMQNLILSEDQECEILADYCRLKKHMFCHINNEFYSKSWKQKNRQLRLGTAKGFPDYIIIVKNYMVCIEMKRLRKSQTSPHQLLWLKALNDAGVEAVVCRGAAEAITFLESL